MSDLLATVKSREIQRGMLAEMVGNQERAARHFLAAAHLELVLANDYAEAGLRDLAFRSRSSAASCFWRAGHLNQSRSLFETVLRDFPEHTNTTHHLLAELESRPPGPNDEVIDGRQ